MKLTPLKALSETIDVKKGIVIYETDFVSEEPGIILSNNTSGDFGMIVINQVHEGGPNPVKIIMRATGAPPVKKYSVNEIVAKLATF